MKTSDQYAAEAAECAEVISDPDYPGHEGRMRMLAYAQVHAQLAVAAAIRETAADVIATLQGRS